MNKKDSKRSWKNFTLDDFKKYYQKNYSGISKQEFRMREPSLYVTLLRENLLHEVLGGYLNIKITPTGEIIPEDQKMNQVYFIF